MAQWGVHGPLPLLGKASFALFLAYAATVSPFLAFPVWWTAAEVSAQIFGAAYELDKRLPVFGWRIAARRCLEKALRAYSLPPLCVRPWTVPAALVSSPRLLRRIAMGGNFNNEIQTCSTVGL